MTWIDPDHGWFGGNKGRIWRTTNGGVTWSTGASGSTNSIGISFKDSQNGIAIHEDAVISVSHDGGASFSGGSVGGVTVVVGVSYVPGSSSAWIASDRIPYRSRDDGGTWKSETPYPFTGGIMHISMADTSVGWAVTADGEVLQYHPGQLVAVGGPDAPMRPAESRLEQNYPNPFNPATEIRFQVSGTSDVKLAVYDILGREVAVLVHEQQGAGSYSVRFDAHGLASGVYLYRLTAGSFSMSRKMLLVR
jgi:hypothetical protein